MELVEGLVNGFETVVEGCFFSLGEVFPLEELLDGEVVVFDGCGGDVEGEFNDILLG